MSRVYSVKCDQCGHTVSSRHAAETGWRSVTAMSLYELFDHKVGGGDHADLCSWTCMRDYANTKANELLPR